MSAEIPVDLRCGECGDTFTLSARRARDQRQRGPLCRSCRRPERELTDRERERLRAWWLERFSPAELQELVSGIWPDARLRP